MVVGAGRHSGSFCLQKENGRQGKRTGHERPIQKTHQPSHAFEDGGYIALWRPLALAVSTQAQLQVGGRCNNGYAFTM